MTSQPGPRAAEVLRGGDGAAAHPWHGERLLLPDGQVYVWLPCRGGWTRIPHLDWRRARGHMPTRPDPRPPQR